MLLDVNVWVAAVTDRHVHHPVVLDWLSRQTADLAMCRITQMGVLRLLSNPSSMRVDVVTRAEAWAVIDQLRADDRVRWVSEPSNLEQVWRAISAREDDSHRLWTDDYLAAFAQAAGSTLVTLDRDFARRYPSVRVETLG